MMNSTYELFTLFDQFNQVKFDGSRFLSLLFHGGENFPEAEAKQFIDEHFIFAFQVLITILN